MTVAELKSLLATSTKFRAWRPSQEDRSPLDFSGEQFTSTGPTWHGGPVPKDYVDHDTLALEPHYDPNQVAEIWGVSSDTVRRMFEDEPGVIKYGHQATRSKRPYFSLRIPQSVMIRVHRKYSAG